MLFRILLRQWDLKQCATAHIVDPSQPIILLFDHHAIGRQIRLP